MGALAFAIPGDIETRTGGYSYDRRVLAELPGLGVAPIHCELPGSFPFPSAGDCAEALAALRRTPAGVPVLVDGLAWGALPHAVAREAAAFLDGGLVALCHHPLGLETGLEPATARFLIGNERMNLALADHVVVPSAAARTVLVRDFAVPAGRISVAEPGTDPAPRAAGAASRDAPGAGVALLCVGAIVPRKGYDVLIEALASMTDLPWRLTIAGSTRRAVATVAALEALIGARDLGGRVRLAGEVGDDDLARLYHESDVFVLASHYEGYGMVLAEAMARGLPIVATTGGAAADTVPAPAGLKVAPGAAAALAAALRAVVGDPPLRERLAEGSWRAGQSLPRWRDTAAIIADAAARAQQAANARDAAIAQANATAREARAR